MSESILQQHILTAQNDLMHAASGPAPYEKSPQEILQDQIEKQKKEVQHQKRIINTLLTLIDRLENNYE